MDSKWHMPLPPQVKTCLHLLRQAACEGYAVGGCVRDALMNQTPKDFDIATNALPAQVAELFAGYKVVETGLKHGTVTVFIDHMPLEITTFRIDGDYIGNRRPRSVRFTRSLNEDLARRDFTVNAMAYSPLTGLVDPYDGRADIKGQVIRCVGEPDRRFGEDALRILRGLRFAARLGFCIESATAQSMEKNRELLRNIAKERIAAELLAILSGPGPGDILQRYLPIFAVFLPDLAAMEDFTQNNPYHCYDVLRHTCAVVDNIPPLPHLRLAALFHDIGKPRTRTRDAQGVVHFYGHAAHSERIARRLMRSLKLDNFTVDRVCTLVRYHDLAVAPNPKAVRKWLHQLGEPVLREILLLRRSDLLGQSPLHREERLAEITAVEAVIDELLRQGSCFALKDLAVKGKDLMEAGLPPGPSLGAVLDALLRAVMEDRLPNAREALLSAAQTLSENPAVLGGEVTPHYVYMLRCADNSLYTGWTNDLAKRLAAHNAGKGAKYTKSRMPVKLVYSEEHPDKSAALRREHALKQLTKAQKEALVATPPKAR